MDKIKSENFQEGEKQKPTYFCAYCTKRCSSPSELKRHVVIHTGQKDYHCHLCDYSAARKGDLTVHIRRHLKEKPFKCPEINCGASFTTSFQLKQHQLVQNKNDKRFTCTFCPFKTHVK